jgi:hypothetical protein
MNGPLSVATPATDWVCRILPRNIPWVFKNSNYKNCYHLHDNRTLKKDLLITLLVYYIICTNLYYNKNALIYANATFSSTPWYNLFVFN